MANINSQKSKWQVFNEAFPLVQLVGGVIIAVCATWTTIQLTQNSQAAEIRRHAERIEKIEKEQTPFILFDERTRTILDNQKQINEKFDKFLEKK